MFLLIIRADVIHLEFAEGDYSDCLKVISSHAELGACTSCPFYRKAGKIISLWINPLKKSIDEEA